MGRYGGNHYTAECAVHYTGFLQDPTRYPKSLKCLKVCKRMNVRARISKFNSLLDEFLLLLLLFFAQAPSNYIMHSYVYYTFSNSSVKVVLYCSLRLASGRLVNATFRIFIVSSSENTISNSHANKFKAVHTFMFLCGRESWCLIRVITKLACGDC